MVFLFCLFVFYLFWFSFLCILFFSLLGEGGNFTLSHENEVWICDPNYHKIRWTFALNFSNS